MALFLSSPCGYAFDEDEEMAVFESTAAEHGGPSRPRLPEISVISPGLNSHPDLVSRCKGLAASFKCALELQTIDFM